MLGLLECDTFSCFDMECDIRSELQQHILQLHTISSTVNVNHVTRKAGETHSKFHNSFSLQNVNSTIV